MQALSVVALVASCQTSAQPPARYTFETGLRRITCCGGVEAPNAAYSLLLIAREVDARIEIGRDHLGVAHEWVKGPLQVRIRPGRRAIKLRAFNKDYQLEHTFEAGRIYEVFAEDEEESVAFQLYSVSPERYEKLHASAPAALRRAPRPHSAQPSALPVGFQRDGSMVLAGDDAVGPLQHALLWPCPAGRGRGRLRYGELARACSLYFPQLVHAASDVTSVKEKVQALDACLEERFRAVSALPAKEISGRDPCEASLGAGWHLPSIDELVRLQWQEDASCDAVRLRSSGWFFAVAEDGVIARTRFADDSSDSDKSLPEQARVICVRSAETAPPPLPPPSCEVEPEIEPEILPDDPDARDALALESRYRLLAERLEAELAAWPAERLARAYPAFADEALDFPDKLRASLPAHTLIPTLEDPAGSAGAERVVGTLRELRRRIALRPTHDIGAVDLSRLVQRLELIGIRQRY